MLMAHKTPKEHLKRTSLDEVISVFSLGLNYYIMTFVGSYIIRDESHGRIGEVLLVVC